MTKAKKLQVTKHVERNNSKIILEKSSLESRDKKITVDPKMGFRRRGGQLLGF
jgi:hypothetical protein